MGTPELTVHKGRAWPGVLTVAALAAGAVAAMGWHGEEAAAAVAPGITQLVSRYDNGDQLKNWESHNPTISADGRWVAFSTYEALDPLDAANDTGPSSTVRRESDIYVRDLRNGRTTLLTQKCVHRSGVEFPTQRFAGNGDSTQPSISADGRYVAFASLATNFDRAPGGRNIHVVDRDPNGDGEFDEAEQDCPIELDTTLISAGLGPIDAPALPISDSKEPAIAGNGTAVAYLTRERSTGGGSSDGGGPPTTVVLAKLSRNASGQLLAARRTVTPALGPQRMIDASHLAISDSASRLVVSGYIPAQIIVKAAPAPTPFEVVGVEIGGPAPHGPDPAIRLSVDEQGGPLPKPPSYQERPALSGDGRWAAFTTAVAGDSSSTIRVTEWPATGTPKSVVASAGVNGQPGYGTDPALSRDGRYLAYATNQRDVHTGVDAPVDPEPCEYSPGFAAGPQAASGSNSSGPNPRSWCDVVVRDLVVDREKVAAGQPKPRAELASVRATRDCVPGLPDTEFCEGDGASRRPVLAADGSVVAFESWAAKLVTPDTNGLQDIFARQFTPKPAAEPVDFGQVEVGSSTLRSARITQEGIGPLAITSVSVAGPQADDFKSTVDTCVGTPLSRGASCLVSVRFAPTASGARRAELQVSYRGSDQPFLVPLTGIGRSRPTPSEPPTTPPTTTSRPPVTTTTPTPPVVAQPGGFSVAPDPVDFGEHLGLSTNPAIPVTVTNNGAGPFTIDKVRLMTDLPADRFFPQDYAISGDGCAGKTVAPGQSCQLSVSHSPQGSGSRPAVLVFDDSAPGGPHLLPLLGSGTAPKVQVNPAVVPAGRPTLVTGTGFAPERDVAVRLERFPELITVKTNSSGGFSAPLLVFPNSVADKRTLIAAVAGHEDRLRATVDFLVVPGSPIPPDFVGRR